MSTHEPTGRSPDHVPDSTCVFRRATWPPGDGAAERVDQRLTLDRAGDIAGSCSFLIPFVHGSFLAAPESDQEHCGWWLCRSLSAAQGCVPLAGMDIDGIEGTLL